MVMATSDQASTQSSHESPIPSPKRQKSTEDGGHSDDRISDLPNSVLLHILSFLPTKGVVATSVLSKRWKLLWASVPCLDFDDRNFLKRGGNVAFRNVVNKILLEHNASIREFRVNCRYSRPCDVDIELWIRKAISRNVQVLGLCVPYNIHTNGGLSVQLPRGIFSCQTLVVLKLIGEALMISVPSTAYLPNLKTLELSSVRYQNEESVTNLISCSLGLENLSIWMKTSKNMPYMHVPKLRIHAPAMKSLQIVKGRHGRASADDVLDISAPALSELTIEDHVSDSLQITNMGSLNKANLNLHKTLSYQWLIKCFEAFRNIKCLSLSGDIPTALNFESGLPLVKFLNLTHLTMGCVWRPMLVYFLQCFEKLQVLRLTKNRSCSGSVHAEELWNDPVLVPRCLMTCLRTIWIQDFRESEFELGMLKYVLKNGKVLQKLEICPADTHCPWNISTREGGVARKFELKFLRSEGNYRQLEAKYSIAKKIMNIQKGSDACEIDIL